MTDFNKEHLVLVNKCKYYMDGAKKVQSINLLGLQKKKLGIYVNEIHIDTSINMHIAGES